MDENETVAAVPENQSPKPRIDVLGEMFDWLEILVLSVTIVFLLFTFVIRVAIVDGRSMMNTLQDKDALAVLELSYQPAAGDVIVLQAPSLGYQEPLVKRVIATAGQTITLDTDNWIVTVDGVKLDEPYIWKRQGTPMRGWDYGESFTVPEGYIFVMGDNRNDSLDSRRAEVGPVNVNYVIGKVIYRFLPWSSHGLIR